MMSVVFKSNLFLNESNAKKIPNFVYKHEDWFTIRNHSHQVQLKILKIYELTQMMFELISIFLNGLSRSVTLPTKKFLPFFKGQIELLPINLGFY